MSGVWRSGVVVLAVFAAAWLCAIAWWRASGVTPGGVGMLAWLVGAPVAILAVLWIGARRRRRRAAEMAGAAEGADAPTPALADDAPPQRPLEILASAARLACGEGVQALAGNLADLPRPELHPVLRDRDGLPVLAACDAGLDVASLAGRLAPAPGQRPAEEHLRALALLEPVALELFDAAARMLPPPPRVEERVVAGLRRREEAAPGQGGGVRAVALLPRDVPPPLRSACDGWLRDLAAEAGLDPGRCGFEVACVPDAGAAWQRIERLVAQDRGGGADWTLLLASGSSIGERGLRALDVGGRLAAPGNPEGVVPGEGAAGLLLRPDGAVPALETDPLPVLAALRTATLDDGLAPRSAARSSAELLVGLVGSAGLAAGDIGLVLSDADQRPSRAVEAAVAAATACPELDPAADCPALGRATGCLGHVAPLALLALASGRARAAGLPVLALSVASGSTRVAALVRIAGADEPDEPASSEPGAPDLAA